MKWLGITSLSIASIVVVYVVAYPSLTLRYRLTLEAEVDGKPKTGRASSKSPTASRSIFEAN